MKRTTKKATLHGSPQSNMFKLEFINYPESSLLIDNVELKIKTDYNGDHHLYINFSCLENENYSSWNYFAPLAKNVVGWEIAKLVIYNSKGDELKTINMSVKVICFMKKLSFHNFDPIKYDIDAIFKLES